MASSSDEVRVPIALPVETNAKQAAQDVGELRDSIARSRDVLKEAATSFRNLRGKTDEVKAAKDQLKAVMDREKQSISEATLKLLKHGSSLDGMSDKTKGAAKAAKAATKDTDALKEGVSQLKAPLAEGAGGMGAMELAAGGMAAAAVAAAAAVGALVVGLARWAIKGADAARSMNLVREAATGSALNAENLGTQIDALAKRVPTSTAALNDLATSLAKSRLGGQTTVDTLNAVAQANAAVGDAGGAKIREIIERGKLAQRMYLGLLELQGTGLEFDDVAEALSRSMKVGVDEARKALTTGRVKLADGAAAMREAVEKKFGGINLRKMMSLEGLAETAAKLGESLTKGINLEPAAKAAAGFLKVFDTSTTTGAVLQRAVTAFGNGIVSLIERGAPLAKQFMRGLIVGGLQIYVTYLQVRNALRGAFGDSQTIKQISTLLEHTDWLNVALEAGRYAINAVAIGVAMLGVAVAGVIAPFVFAGKAIKSLIDTAANAREAFKVEGWTGLGRAIVDGLVSGIKGQAQLVVDTVKGLGTAAKESFKASLGIHSPSRVFAEFGRQTTAGFEQGVTQSAPKAEAAVSSMVSPPSAEARAGAGSGGSATFNITLVVQSTGGTPQAQAEDPKLLEAVTKLFRDAAAAAGFAVGVT